MARYIERHSWPILERIQDHPAKRISELLPWVYQAMIDAQKEEAEAKNDA